jgi:hypothetical protein
MKEEPCGRTDVEYRVPTLAERRARFICDTMVGFSIVQSFANPKVVVRPYWDGRDKAFQESFIKAVEEECQDKPHLSPEESHKRWMEDHLKMGWKYGECYDRDAKTHPDLVPYDELPQWEKDKDEVFLVLCDIAKKYIKE